MSGVVRERRECTPTESFTDMSDIRRQTVRCAFLDRAEESRPLFAGVTLAKLPSMSFERILLGLFKRTILETCSSSILLSSFSSLSLSGLLHHATFGIGSRNMPRNTAETHGLGYLHATH